MDYRSSLLLTDLYQLNMLQAYVDRGLTETAVFELFFRRLPPRRGFLMAAGLETALDFLENLRFGPEELDWLARSGRFGSDFIDYLGGLRFTGDVDALPEGTVFFADEPLIRIVAPLPVAQLAETRLMNLLHFQSLIASKAARMVLAAPGKTPVDFGLRRAHGAEAGLLAARSAYIAGFAGTATTLAEPLYGIPVYGTMAHSFVQVHDDETAAFESFARSRPDSLVLLIDTYDTKAGARKVAALAPRLRAEEIEVRGVRLDSGDLADLARRVRAILDAAGERAIGIFASGGLDEDALSAMTASGAPIDGYGIGTSLTTSSDVPAFDCAYKLQEYAGVARRKLSAGKVTWPGRKQAWRRLGADGRILGDVLTIEGDQQDGRPLLAPAMRGGRRLAPAPSPAAMREHAASALATLPEPLRRLTAGTTCPVSIAPALAALAAEVDARLKARQGGSTG